MSLSQLIKEPILLFNQYRVIALQASVYPALFVRALLAKITRDGGVKPTVLDLATHDVGQIKLRLATSFLGQKCFFWFGDTSQYSLKSSAALMNFLASYQGEHSVLIYTPQVLKGPLCITIECPEKINEKLLSELVVLYTPEQQKRIHTLVRAVYKRVAVLTLEQALLVMDYAQVLGANRELFFDEWFDLLVKPEMSLFQLSSLLLARDPAFWQLWSSIKPAYEFPFWVSYFSELFFRAYHYGQYRKQNQLIEAKKIGYRLPFSFIQRDWQKMERALLCAAHDRLTMVDYQLKNGATPVLLDSVFVQFFA